MLDRATNDGLIIRRALLDDARAIARFNVAMAAETEGLSLDPDTVRGGVEACILDPTRGFYLIAETQVGRVGQLMVTYEWSDWRKRVFYWIQSVYVGPRWRRRGIYRALYDEVRRIAEEADDVAGIRLYVHYDNIVAREVYSELGMREAPYRMYEVDFVIDRDAEP